MGCGGSKVSAVDGDAIDGDEIARQNSENGIKVSSNEETEQKSVQFSPEIKTNVFLQLKMIRHIFLGTQSWINHLFRQLDPNKNKSFNLAIIFIEVTLQNHLL